MIVCATGPRCRCAQQGPKFARCLDDGYAGLALVLADEAGVRRGRRRSGAARDGACPNGPGRGAAAAERGADEPAHREGERAPTSPHVRSLVWRQVSISPRALVTSGRSSDRGAQRRASGHDGGAEGGARRDARRSGSAPGGARRAPGGAPGRAGQVREEARVQLRSRCCSGGGGGGGRGRGRGRGPRGPRRTARS